MLHQVGVSFDLYYDVQKHKIKIVSEVFVATLSSFWNFGLILFEIRSQAFPSVSFPILYLLIILLFEINYKDLTTNCEIKRTVYDYV